MERLRELDQIAYIRFASVYQSFDDLEQLKREVDTLFAARAIGRPPARPALELLPQARRAASAGSAPRTLPRHANGRSGR